MLKRLNGFKKFYLFSLVFLVIELLLVFWSILYSDSLQFVVLLSGFRIILPFLDQLL